ncbi:MAG: dephospho-CoA kinase [Bacteroidetes bacterium]|nr:dephospho-CoA kinase [Bacteroidota bacterium]
MTVIGLTGRICSGKNLAAEYLSGLGYVLVDVDRLGHEILDREVAAAAAIFGSDIRKRDGGADREVLSRKVFNNISLLKKLENFLHPLMVKTCNNVISSLDDNSPGIVLNAAVLSRMGLDTLCDSVLFISAPFCMRFLRARKSRGMKLNSFVKRNRNQRDIRLINLIGKYKVFRVMNIGSTRYLHKKLDSIVKILDIIN